MLTALFVIAAPVMKASTYVEDVDLKGAEFCGNCRIQLDERTNPPNVAGT